MSIKNISLFWIIIFISFPLLSDLYSQTEQPSSPSLIKIENFSKPVQKNGIPDGWEVKEDDGKIVCSILKNDKENSFLHIMSKKSSGGIHKAVDIDTKQYPYFTWKWKVTKLPLKGDVRKRSTDDQAGNIYIVFPGGFPETVRSKIVSYLLESNAPKGLMTTSPKRGNTKNIVLESGNEKLGEWITEKRNVYEDYKKLFHEEPPKTVKICIWIDSDDTESEAEAFYDDLMFSRD